MDKCFYMKRYDLPNQTPKNLEIDFQGLKYLSCKGLSDVGKPKNIVVEEFADNAENKIYIPENIYHEPTDFVLSLVFTGAMRRKAYDDFCTYIKNGKFYYWDTVRKRKVSIVLLSPIRPTDDIFKGSSPFIKVDFTFTNILGKSTPVNNDGTAV